MFIISRIIFYFEGYNALISLPYIFVSEYYVHYMYLSNIQYFTHIHGVHKIIKTILKMYSVTDKNKISKKKQK